jgi:hypothetical protein
VIAAHPQMPEAAELTQQLVQVLHERRLEVLAGEVNDESLRQQVRARPADLFIALEATAPCCGPATCALRWGFPSWGSTWDALGS